MAISSIQDDISAATEISNNTHNKALHQHGHITELGVAREFEFSPIYNGVPHGGDPDKKTSRSILALMAYENGNVNALMALANEAKTTPGLGQVLIDTFKNDMSSAEFNAVKKEVLEGDTAGLAAVSRQYGHG